MSQKYLNLYKHFVEYAMYRCIYRSEYIEDNGVDIYSDELDVEIKRLESIINKIEYRLLNGYKK